jgi:acyl-CoA thioesterase-1
VSARIVGLAFLLATASVCVTSSFGGTPQDELRQRELSRRKFLSQGDVRAEKTANPERIDPALPNVLVIGMSSAIRSTPIIREQLQGKYNVFGIPDNARTTTYSLSRIDGWLAGRKWDVIVFHWGGADSIETPISVFESNLRLLIAKLRRTGARLLYTNMTPVPSSIKAIDGEHLDLDAQLQKYNAVAARVMKEECVDVVDLYRYVRPYVAEYVRFEDLRFSEAGLRFVAKIIANAVVDPAQLGSDYKPPRYRYYLMLFSYQLGDVNPPDYRSHTFGVFVKATAKDQVIDQKTISWLPANNFATLLMSVPVKGRNYTLEDTCELALKCGSRLSRWGPFEIRPELYYKAEARVRELESGRHRYIVLDKYWITQKEGAVMCIHAISDIAGHLKSGDKRGEAASRAVVEHFRPWIVQTVQDGAWLERSFGLSKYRFIDRTAK